MKLHRYGIMKKNRGKSRSVSRGMTFIEVMLAASLTSLIGLALYQSFSHGLKIWERANQFAMEEEIVIFLDRIEQDLQNAFVYAQFPFIGQEQRLAFATMVNTPKDPSLTKGEIDYALQMGRAEYYLDPSDLRIYRQDANYSQAVNGEYGPARVLTRPIQNLNFSYAVIDQFGGLSFVRITDKLPVSIRVEVEYTDVNGQSLSMTKTINIPLMLQRK